MAVLEDQVREGEKGDERQRETGQGHGKMVGNAAGTISWRRLRWLRWVVVVHRVL